MRRTAYGKSELPYQYHVYRGYSRETGIVRFIRNQDPIFAAYRYLARAPGVAAVWQTDRAYFNLPGYPVPPPNSGVRFIDEAGPGTSP